MAKKESGFPNGKTGGKEGPAKRPKQRSNRPAPEYGLTALQAKQRWPDMTPWPLPAPIHGKPGLTKMTGWEQQELLDGPTTPEEIFGGMGPQVLAVLIRHAKALKHDPIVRQCVVARHESYGPFYLRAVAYSDGGYLIGIADDSGATYCACEWYGTDEEAAQGWHDWITTCAGPDPTKRTLEDTT